jgi:TRAP-type C4-dicarboxylate transport system substrate-binding protein
MGAFTLAGASSVAPEIALLSTPFLFDSVAERDCVLDNHMAPLLDDLFQAKGLKMLQYSYAGTIGVASKTPILSPSDAEGVKMRSNEAKHSIMMWEATGASVVPLSIVDTPSALQTGLADGTPFSPIFFLATGINKLAPHYTWTQHEMQAGFYLVNLKAWNALSEEQQGAITTSPVPTAEFRAKIRGMEQAMLAKYIEANGPVHEMSAAQRQEWADAVSPYYTALVDDLGADAHSVWDLLISGKAACGS